MSDLVVADSLCSHKMGLVPATIHVEYSMCSARQWQYPEHFWPMCGQPRVVLGSKIKWEGATAAQETRSWPLRLLIGSLKKYVVRFLLVTQKEAERAVVVYITNQQRCECKLLIQEMRHQQEWESVIDSSLAKRLLEWECNIKESSTGTAQRHCDIMLLPGTETVGHWTLCFCVSPSTQKG